MNYRIITAAEAATYINDGDGVGISGFTLSGTPKTVLPEVAKRAELRTIKRHSSSVASVPFFIRFAAEIPMGVAAFPKPRKFAQMLALRSPARAVSWQVLGNSLCRMGDNRRESVCVKPIPSINLPTPVHRQRLPAMETARVTPAWAPSSIEAERALAFPVIIALRTAIPTKSVHTQLITIYTTPSGVQYANFSRISMDIFDKIRMFP